MRRSQAQKVLQLVDEAAFGQALADDGKALHVAQLVRRLAKKTLLVRDDAKEAVQLAPKVVRYGRDLALGHEVAEFADARQQVAKGERIDTVLGHDAVRRWWDARK